MRYLRLLERLALRPQIFPEVLILWHQRPAGAQPIHLRLLDAGRNRALFAQLFRRVQQTPPDANDHRVGRAERLLAAINYRTLAPGNRAVLDDDARHARVPGHGAAGLLDVAVDAEIV